MASSAIKGIMNFFKGKESAKEEKAEKKVSPAMYRKGEKAEGEKVKSTPAKKSMGSAAPKKAVPVKKTVAKKK